MGREERMASTRPVSALMCWLTYLTALACVAFVFARPQSPDPFWNGLIAHVASTVVIWFFSLATSNSSLYDPAWCVLPIAVVYGWMYTADSAPSIRGWYSLALLLLWFCRYNICCPWAGWFSGIDSEDWRYVQLAQSTGSGTPLYWLLSLTSFHLTPTFLVWFGLSPAMRVWTAQSSPPLGPRDIIAVALSLGALLVQTFADETLRRFRERAYGGKADLRTATSSKKVCREGLWAYSRHPNYFGEASFWLGMACIGWANDTGTEGRSALFTWAGAGLMFAFFRLSASLMDARNLKHRGEEYAKVMKEVSALIPMSVLS